MNPLRLIFSLLVVALASLMASIRQTASRIETASFGSPKAASTTAIHAAITDKGAEQKVKTGITNPPTARTITATAGGTAADIKPIKVKVIGTNSNGEKIEEELPAFTENTAGTVEGKKAFATVTQVNVPAHDGEGATTAIGFGNVFGFPCLLTRNSVVAAYLNGVKEGTAPTVTVGTKIDECTIKLNSAPNETPILVDFYR